MSINERPDYEVWTPANAPTIEMWPPAKWLDDVIREAIAEYVEKEGFFHIIGNSLDFMVWCQGSEVIAEKKVVLSEALAEAVDGGSDLPELREVLVAAIAHLDSTLLKHPDWAVKGEESKD